MRKVKVGWGFMWALWIGMVAIVLVWATLAPAAAVVPSQTFWGGRITCTADASGYCTVNHPAGTTPDAVAVTPAVPAIVSTDQFTATTFRVRFISSAGQALTGTRTFSAIVTWVPGGPSPTPSPTTSPSPSPSPSPSVSPSPSPSPSPTGPPPPVTFPDATNTGVPAGTVLTTVNGDVTLSTANQVYDAKEVNGCITVTAPGVTISRSKVHCGGSSAVGYFDHGVQTARLTVSDSEIDCLNTAGRTAIGDTNITARRVNVHGCENGFDVDQWVTIEDSYVHDLANTAASHTDGIQLAHYLINCPPCTEIPHARNVIVQHNRIYGTGSQGAGTSAMISNPTGDENVTVQNNLIAGGAYTLYCDYQGVGSNYQVIDNRVSRLFSANGGAFGPWDGCTDEAVVRGNVWDDTGQPLT